KRSVLALLNAVLVSSSVLGMPKDVKNMRSTSVLLLWIPGGLDCRLHIFLHSAYPQICSALHIRGVISSTGSSQVLTPELSLSQPAHHLEASPTFHDRDVQSFSFSRQPMRKRRSACLNAPLSAPA